MQLEAIHVDHTHQQGASHHSQADSRCFEHDARAHRRFDGTAYGMSKFGREGRTTEFKRQLNDALEKEVVAFLNSAKGGDLYIGVDDEGEALVHGGCQASCRLRG